MSFEIQKADPAARWRTIKWCIVVLICGGILLSLADPLSSRVIGWATADPERFRLRVGLSMAALALLTVLPLSAIAAYALSLARRIDAAERYPPPDMPVAQDTLVRSGEPALRRARLLRALGWAVVVGMVILIYLFVRIWQMLAGAGAPQAPLV